VSEIVEHRNSQESKELDDSPENRYTYQDYLLWPDYERWEIIDGAAYNLTLTPSRRHQEVSLELFKQISACLDGQPSKIFYAPFDVRLPEIGQKDEDASNVVQPDLLVVCDMAKLDDKGCIGAPDLIIEILSPSTAAKDYIKKLDLYEKSGVKEYWIVHPADNIVMVYLRGENSQYGRPKIFAAQGEAKISVLENCIIDLKLVFTGK